MTTDPVTLEVVADVVRRRRTSLHVDRERTVPDPVLEQLVELASWAPCHKRTWPWRFAVATGAGRARLGEVAADAMAERGDDPAKVDKTRTKYLRAPAVMVIGSVPGDTPLRTVENRDATSAAVQNLLLAATAAGLASHWASCPTGAEAPVAALCGFEPGTAIVGFVYLGWPTGEVDAPARPVVRLQRLDG